LDVRGGHRAGGRRAVRVTREARGPAALSDSGGGAAAACGACFDEAFPDFLFPQMQAGGLVSPEWEPTFLDYLYVSFTNVTAFSPTDTLPLSRWAKLLMMLQATISVLLVVLVIARAVNVLH
jgi:hypothetical protein